MIHEVMTERATLMGGGRSSGPGARALPDPTAAPADPDRRPAVASPAKADKPASRSVERDFKRILDIGVAAAVLLIVSPAMAVLALGVWATLGTPICYRQARPGLKGRPFVPLKFRTMRIGPGKDEVRMTRFGRFMRQLSLDELPQLWNVLRGDMSLVGPRPLLMAYLPRYTPRLLRRHDMKPGITGWCQVNGRNSLTWDQKFEYDLWYVGNWSILIDLKILLKTAGRVLGKSGIEGPGYRCWPEEPGSNLGKGHDESSPNPEKTP